MTISLCVEMCVVVIANAAAERIVHVYVSRLPVIASYSINVGYQPWSWRIYPKIRQMNHQCISPPMMVNVHA